jgi:hypothetical protein
VAALVDFAELTSRYLFDLGFVTGDSEKWQPGNSIERMLAATKQTGGLGLGAPNVHQVMMKNHDNLNVGQIFWSGQVFKAHGQVYDGSAVRNTSPMITGVSTDGKLTINREPFTLADGTTAYTITISSSEMGVESMIVTRDWDSKVMDAEVITGTATFTDTWAQAPYWVDSVYNYGRAAYWPRYSVLMSNGKPKLRFNTTELVQLYNDVVTQYTPAPRFVDWFGRYVEDGGDYNPYLNINLEWGDRVRSLGLNPETDNLATIWRVAAEKLAAERGIELPAETPIDQIVNSTAAPTVVVK